MFMISFLNIIIQIFILLIIIRVILSWLRIDNSFVHDTTEWILGPIRGLLPLMGVLDLSPMIAIIVLQLFADFLWSYLV